MKISIVTVSYNSEKTIEQTIQSVIGQTYKNIEYIIIDGGSNDSTINIIEKYRNKVECFVSEPDEGIYNAMNKGIRMASGDIIGIINSDDWYDRNTVEKAVEYFNKNEIDVLYGDCVYLYEDGKRVRNMKFPLEAMWYLMATPHPTVFVKKKVYQKYGIFNESYQMAADYELLLRFYSAGLRFGYLEYDMAYFRAGGATTKRIVKSLQETKDIALNYARKYNKTEFLQTICERYDQRIESETKKIQLKNAEDKRKMIPKIMLSYLGDNEGITVFGTGAKGKECLKRLRDWGIPIKMFVDNDAEKWGVLFEGIPVCRPCVLEERNEKIIVASTIYSEDICSQIENMGFKENKNYIKIAALDAYIVAEGEKMNIYFDE
jgi:Glycosyltransferases involved in cell wall biogenesis